MDGKAFSEFVKSRRSIRDFDSKREIDEALLKKILIDAQWAPSWCNTSPYYLCLARGEQKERIKKGLTTKFDEASQAAKGGWMDKAMLYFAGGAPDGDYDASVKYDKDLKEHQRACGYGLYNLLGIKREDRKARDAQVRRNFEFFDAPAVFFVFCHGDMGPFSPLDLGFFLQTLLLSAHANGLGTCAQGALAIWGSPVREEFQDVPKGYKLVCGVSMGYATDAKVNTFNPGRREPRGTFNWTTDGTPPAYQCPYCIARQRIVRFTTDALLQVHMLDNHPGAPLTTTPTTPVPDETDSAKDKESDTV